MTRGDPEEVDVARERVIVRGEAFRRAAVPALEAALDKGVQRLVASEPEWHAAMNDDVRTAFRNATERAIAQGVTDVEARLTDDVWLDPYVAPGMERSPATVWEGDLPDWVVSVLRVLTRRPRPEPLGELDDVANRAWIALLAAAKPLDPVLEEFGLMPSGVPDLGGGNFGLAPRNAEDLDPDGSLRSSWNRYRAEYERYRSRTPPQSRSRMR